MTVVLTDIGDDKTEMVFHWGGGHLPPDEYPRAKQGWTAFLERMATHLVHPRG